MSLNFDFWSPPYDYHPPLIKGDIIHVSSKIAVLKNTDLLLDFQGSL